MWLALILPEPALQATLRGSTDDAPLALVERHPRAVVVAANPAALAAGVVAGQPLAGALAIAPALRLAEHEPARAAALLDEVANWAGRFTPTVSIDPPDCVLLEVAASLRLFGGLQALLDAVRRGLDDLGLSHLSGWAPTPLAARWLTRAADAAPLTAAGRLGPALDALPLAALADGGGVDDEVLALLHAIGCRRLAEVAALPRDALARRHGQRVGEALDRAFGRRPDPRPCHVPPARYRARLPLLVPTERSDTLLFLLRRLLAGLAGWLGARHAGVDRLQLVLEHEGRRPDSVLEVLCGSPCRDEQRLLLLIREHLERLTIDAEVDALRLEAAAPVPLPALPGDFFDDRNLLRENGELLLARLRARLGPDAVRHLHARAEHRPEQAFAQGQQSGTPPELPAGARPLWLLPRPEPLDPARLSLLDGPERIESGWWDEREVCRDYYLARGRDGSLLWVYRELQPPRGWYLHGYFG